MPTGVNLGGIVVNFTTPSSSSKTNAAAIGSGASNANNNEMALANMALSLGTSSAPASPNNGELYFDGTNLYMWNSNISAWVVLLTFTAPVSGNFAAQFDGASFMTLPINTPFVGDGIVNGVGGLGDVLSTGFSVGVWLSSPTTAPWSGGNVLAVKTWYGQGIDNLIRIANSNNLLGGIGGPGYILGGGWTGSNPGSIVSPSNSWTAGNWTHVVITVDFGGNATMYVNAVSCGVDPNGPMSGIGPGPMQWYLGLGSSWVQSGGSSGDSDTYFANSGQMDALQFFNTVLTPVQVTYLYNSGAGRKNPSSLSANLVANYLFDNKYPKNGIAQMTQIVDSVSGAIGQVFGNVLAVAGHVNS